MSVSEALVHDLQQDVEEIGVRLLDLVEHEHAVGVLADGVGQKAALIEADVARRRADQARDRVSLHVLAHVEANELDAEHLGELPRELGLADARRAGEEEGADRLVRRARPARASLMDAGELLDGVVLAEDVCAQLGVEVLEPVAARWR